MKIIYLIPGTYRKAGMERILAEKVNHFAGRGYDMLVVTTDQQGRANAFDFDTSVRFIDLNIGYEDNNGASFFNKLLLFPLKKLRHFVLLRSLLIKEKADIVVSMFCNDASFVPYIHDGSRKVLEVHFSRFKKLQYERKGLWAIADRMRYHSDERIASRYERFAVLTHEDASYWGKIPGIVVIPNPRTFSFDEPAALDNRQVIAVGRYEKQKGFDMLLQAWKSIDTRLWTLRICGQGSEVMPDLPDNVIVGLSPDIRKEYTDSSIFVLSSRYEGLPLALLEAQAAGLPSVCFKCKCGPRDIITDNVDGILVDEGDVEGLAAGILRLMQDRALRHEMGGNAFANSDNYSKERIFNLWEKLFAELS